MDRARLILLSVVILVLVLLSGSWAGRPPSMPTPSTTLSAPYVGMAKELASTWFCTAGAAPGEPVAHHQLFISNTASSSTDVRVTAYGPKGAVGSKLFELEANGRHVVDLDQTFSSSGLSAMVESPAGAVAVQHWILSPERGDSAPCQRTASSKWYFPSQTTLSGATAQLVLFNPFSSDAGVDISAAVADGLRSPAEWAGVVVPAGTTRTIDLAEQVQRRDQFSLTVKVRSGRLFAETVQTFSGIAVASAPSVEGLVIGQPAASAERSWTFAGGFKDPGASEILTIENPGTEPATVRVQVTPYGSAEMAPEPFDVKVPARRYATLDLTKEGRVPDVGFHSISIESDVRHPVVVARQIRLSAGPDGSAEEGVTPRVELDRGVAADIGATGAAANWWVTGILSGEPNAPLAFVYNPGDRPVSVDVSGTDDSGRLVGVTSGLKIRAGDGAAVDLSGKSFETPKVRTYRISASGPVMVEQLTTMTRIPDFSLGSAFPMRD